jgi:hypothetical protein
VTPIFIRRPQILAFWIALDWNPAGGRSNLEDSIERLLAEPGTVGSRVMTLKSILANSHRFAHASMALDAYRSRISATPGRPAFLVFAADVEKVLTLLAATLRGTDVARRNLPEAVCKLPVVSQKDLSCRNSSL